MYHYNDFITKLRNDSTQLIRLYMREFDTTDEKHQEIRRKEAQGAATEAPPVPTVEEYREKMKIKYGDISCDRCRDSAEKLGYTEYEVAQLVQQKCIIHPKKEGGTKKRSRRLRRGKYKSKFQRQL